MLTMDNAKEFIQGDMALEMQKRSIQQNPVPPYSPNKSPTERWIGIVTEGARSMLHLSGLDPSKYWSDAIEARVEIQNHMASHADPTTAVEKATGARPNVSGLRIFGYEALSYVEKEKRYKFDPKFERCINLGPSPAHSHLTFKLLNLHSGQELF